MALIFGAAPTVGDTGSCGKTARDIDEARFASARKRLDAQRCQACGITSSRCAAARDPNVPSDVGFPPTCLPLWHDAEVCLDALAAASCGDYARFVADDQRLVPSECDFCRGDTE
jgi:hypothetical protein